MSVQELYDAALEVIRQHNEAIGSADAPGFVKEEDFLTCLKASGGTSVEVLTSLSHENVLACLPDHNGVKPFPLAKAINKVLRSGAKDDSPESGKYVSARRVERLSLKELVEHFDPLSPTNPVGERLKRESRGEHFIVYANGRDIDVEATLVCLKEVKQGYEGRATYEGKKVWGLGDIPENYADENPIFEGRPLRPDGSCDQLNRSWQGVPHSVRQFVRFAMEYENGVDVNDRTKQHAVLDMALEGDAMKKFKERHTEVMVEFEEVQSNTPNKLPDLKIPLGTPLSIGQEDIVAGCGNPF